MSEEQWTDVSIQQADFDAVTEELIRQHNKWGVQTRSPFEWLAYLTEEVGEVSDAIQGLVYGVRTIAIGRDMKKEIYDECIQVATLALKMARMVKQ